MRVSAEGGPAAEDARDRRVGVRSGALAVGGVVRRRAKLELPCGHGEAVREERQHLRAACTTLGQNVTACECGVVVVGSEMYVHAGAGAGVAEHREAFASEKSAI